MGKFGPIIGHLLTCATEHEDHPNPVVGRPHHPDVRYNRLDNVTRGILSTCCDGSILPASQPVCANEPAMNAGLSFESVAQI
jgi:hypothetical protein